MPRDQICHQTTENENLERKRTGEKRKRKNLHAKQGKDEDEEDKEDEQSNNWSDWVNQRFDQTSHGFPVPGKETSVDFLLQFLP